MYTHKQGLIFRKAHTGDLHELLKMKQESWWGTHRTSIINIEDQKKWYDNLGHSNLVMVAETKGSTVTKKIVGVGLYTSIDWQARTADISGILKPEFRTGETAKSLFGCGVDFAFEILNLMRVSGEIVESHLAVRKLDISYLEFRVEGRRRKSVYKSGRYYDSIQIGLLREEWEQSKRVQSLSGETGCCNENFDHVKALEYINMASKKEQEGAAWSVRMNQ